MAWGEFSEARFKKTFRISRDTFSWILSKIDDDIKKEDTGKGCIEPNERLAICLYRLTRGDYLFSIGELFGYAECTVCEIVIEVCVAITNALWESCVKNIFSKGSEDFKEATNLMNAEWQFHFAFSTTGGSHLSIKCPECRPEAMQSYFNFKRFNSIVLKALVDARYKFIWASIRAPGNTHDSTNLQSTKMQDCDGVEIPPMILGDGKVPFRSWLMKPYGNDIPSEEEKYFNYRLSWARMIVEVAFGVIEKPFSYFIPEV